MNNNYICECCGEEIEQIETCQICGSEICPECAYYIEGITECACCCKSMVAV